MPNDIPAFLTTDALLALGQDRLSVMREAARAVCEAVAAARHGGSNVVSDLLRACGGEFREGEHFPDDNVRDAATGSQYYYHAHRPGEHGHFHTYIMKGGLPPEAKPTPRQRLDLRDKDYPDPFCHLIAIGMDDDGMPAHLFTTNRWVTQEVVYPAETVIAMLDRFRILHTQPAWATNRFVTALIVLFQPQIAGLIRLRDARFAQWAAKHPGKVVFEDTRLEITSIAKIDLAAQVAAVEAAAAQAGLAPV